MVIKYGVGSSVDYSDHPKTTRQERREDDCEGVKINLISWVSMPGATQEPNRLGSN